MADDLKRVGLVFKEDGAVDFKRTLQEVNLELNKNYNQFKLTQAQWDSSTKSTEKLRAEQEYLKNAYEIQNDKVSTLRMQLADLENAENKNTTAIKKKRNELTSAEVKLESYNKRIKEIEIQLTNTGKKMEEWGKNVEKIGNKVNKLGNKLSTNLTLPITALGTAAITTGNEFEAQMSRVQAIAGATAEELKQLTNQAIQLGAKTSFNASQVAEGMENLASAGFATNEIMEAMPGLLDLAASSGAELANASEIAASAIRGFGLEANTAGHVADVFAEAAARTNAQTEDLGEAMKYVAPVAKTVGLTLEETAAAIGIMSDAGVKGSQAGTTLRGGLTRIVKPTKQVKEAMETLGVEFYDNNGKMKSLTKIIEILQESTEGLTDEVKNQALAQIFGTNALSGMLALVNRGPKELSKMTKSFEKCDGAAEKMAETMLDNAAGSIESLMGSIESAGIAIQKSLSPTIKDLTGKIQNLVDDFTNLSEEEQLNIIKTTGLVAAIGPLTKVLGGVTTTAGKVTQGIGTLSQAIGVLKTGTDSGNKSVDNLATKLSALSNPALLAVAAIGTVTAAVSYFALKESEAEEKAREFAEEMQNQKKGLDEYNAAIDETTNANLSHINSVDKLTDELQELVNENGKVKDGYKARVSFILNELNEALGTEYELNGNLIEGYKNLQGEIDTLIKKKKAEIQLSSEEEKYKNAIENQEQAVADLKTAYEKLQDTQNKYGMNLDELKAKAQEYYEMANNQAVTGGSSFAKKAWEKNADAIQNVIDAYDDAEYRVKTYTEQVKEYTSDYELFMEGKYDEIANVITGTTQDWSDKSLETIKDSIDETAKNLEVYKKIYENTGNEIAKTQAEQADKSLKELTEELVARTNTVNSLSTEEINAWKTLADNSVTEYSTALSKLDDETRTRIEEATGVISKDTTLTTASTDRASRMNNSFDNKLAFSDITKNELSRTSTSMEKDTSVKKAAKDLAGDADDGFNDNVDGAEWGKDLSKEISTSMTSKTSKSWITSAASKVAGWISSYLHFTLPEKGPLSDMDESMPDMIDLMTEGIDKNKSKVIKSAKNMASDINNEIGSINGNVSLNGNASHSGGNIDYQKMADAFSKALTNCKFTLDEDGFARIVKDELYKAV